MSFDRPWVLALLLLLIPYGIWVWESRSLMGGRGFASGALRAASLIALILAMAGAKRLRSKDALCALVVLDRSESVNGLDVGEGLDQVRALVQSLKPKDQWGLVAFGRDAQLEAALGRGRPPSEFHRDLDTGATNLAGALELASAILPTDMPSRIVLMSDGRETLGDALQEAGFLAIQGVQIDPIVLRPPSGPDAAILDVDIPSEWPEDEPIEFRVSLSSKALSKATLKVLEEGQIKGAFDLALQGGKDAFPFTMQGADPGFHKYEFRLESEGDLSQDNNAGFGYVNVAGPARALVFESATGVEAPLIQALQDRGFAVEAWTSGSSVPSIDELDRFDVVILSDVPATRFTSGQLEDFKNYVEILGGGLVMVGGEDSFGPGGYYKTPVEEILPVSMDLRRDKHLPSLAMVVCLDKSGSMAGMEMGREKVDLAKEGCILAMEELEPWDEFGVVAFDFAAKWALPFSKLEAMQDSVGLVASIRAGGGTAMFPSLALAVEALRKSKAMFKHIVAFTDGQTLPGDFDHAVDACLASAITLSTVSIGTDADVLFLKELADKGKGRFYDAAEFDYLPRIFAKEAIIASRGAFVEEAFAPKLVRPDPTLTGPDWEKVPPLLGYVMTTPKDRAEALLQTHKGDPLLSRWHKGLGKTLAFTSDAKGRWASNWVPWEGYQGFWAQQIRWVARASKNPEIFLEAKKSAVGNVIRAEVVSGEASRRLFASIVGPDGQAFEQALKRVGPRIYEAVFEGDQKGSYLVGLAERIGEESLLLATTGLNVPYNREHEPGEPNVELLNRLAQVTGGKILASIKDASLHDLPPKRSASPMAPWLIRLAILLLPLEIAVRRLWIPWQRLWPRRKGEVAFPSREGDETLSRLRRAKDKEVAALPQVAAERTSPTVPQSPEKTAVPQKPEAPASPPQPSTPSCQTLSQLLESRKKRKKEEE